MATFTPITVTRDNMDMAIKENIRLAYAALESKLKVTEMESIQGDLNANSNNVRAVKYDNSYNDQQPLTREKLTALMS